MILCCPRWCQTDHEAEMAEWLRWQHEALQDELAHPEEMLRVLGEHWTPPTDAVPGDEEPRHEQTLGEFLVPGREGEMVPVRVTLDQFGKDQPSLVTILPGAAWYEDGYTPDQARALARLLVVGAEVLERAQAGS